MQSRHRHYSKKLFLINANWTSLDGVEGWKHYRITARRGHNAKVLELEMMAVCDREVRFWIKRRDLRNLTHWSPGWI